MIEIKCFATGSKGNMYTVFDGTTKLMIEAGIPIQRIKKALDFQVTNLGGVLVSHSHLDHSKSVKDLLRIGVDVYMPKGTQESLNLEHHRIKTVEAKKQFRMGTWIVLPFDVQHDVECFGYLLINQLGERLLFATDTYYIKYRFSELTHIMIEANYSMDILTENIEAGRVPTIMQKRLIKSHFSLENVKEFLKANDLNKVQEIHLLHLSDSNSDEALFKREIQELTGKLVFVP